MQLIVATGKARGPWVPEVLPRLGTTLPGVFLQGLLIADNDGNILHSRWVILEGLLQLKGVHPREGKGAACYFSPSCLAQDWSSCPGGGAALGTTLPGVLLQGLLIADNDGNILHSTWMNA